MIWWEYQKHHQELNIRKLFLWAWLAPVLMSGLIEIVQEKCTTDRCGEWLDFAANTTGVCLGAVIGLLMKRYWFKRSNKSPNE